MLTKEPTSWVIALFPDPFKKSQVLTNATHKLYYEKIVSIDSVQC